MPKFAANLTMLFTELEFPERFAAAADAGFKGVESLFPYVRSKDDIADWLAAAGLEMVLINMPAGDWENGERGITCLPDRRAEFRDGVGKAIEYAQAINCRNVHAVAGLAPAPGPERAAFEDTYRENMAWAADQLAAHGLNLMMEPINGKRDVPGMFLQTTNQARGIMAELARPNLRLQFDVYHVQIMEGDLVRRFQDCLPHIGHVQIANPPDRREPDEGEINYPYLFDAIDAMGYDGWIGCEYMPRAGTRAGLGWGADYGLKND
ncbi:MAG: hydroxypyruvate isomerase family protein [Alphaproteobacteria bacterium]|nr:hydroxypyruvate isomerase family protein [Alphaproteobacteria bacterium]